MTIPRATRQLGLALLACCLHGSGCADAGGPDSFDGVWTGSNAVFSEFRLNLAQSGDAAFGGATFMFAATAATVADTDFVAAVSGDSLTFSKPVPLFTGYASIDFQGRRSGSRIEGRANGSPIVLVR